ncbi:MAG: proprotein convertase P-domain-containing protein, partial [Anaerolineae bacterium]|nr:proprotein convertase P-domain-containing protein [Anaerolineae bacterium]
MLVGLILIPTLLGPGQVLADGPPICSTPNVPIPDFDNNTDLPGVVTDTIAITGTGLITDLNVSISASHTWVGDLHFTLTHEDTGTGVTLIDRPGTPPGAFGCSGDDIEAILDDEASEPVENECVRPGPVAISGVFTPNESLAAFDGEDLSGLWHLTVADEAAVSQGTLVEWCLIPSPQADLAVDKTVDEPVPDEEDLIVYTVTVENNGPHGATDLIISDTLPLSLTLVEANPGQGSYAAGLWDIGDLEANAQATLTLSATVEPGTAGQTIINTAEVFSVTQFDGTGANNRAEAPLTVALADLAVNKTVDEPNPNENDTIEYTVTVGNNGPTAATGVVLSDTLPAGVTFDS